MEKEQKNILQFYYAYILAVICNVIPSSNIQTFGALLFIVIFIATYYFRGKSEKASLTYNHMQFIIKSIWVSSLILLIGMGAAYVLADHQIVYNAFEAIKNGMILNEAQINSLLMDYMRANIFIFILTLMPCLIYLVFRLCKGIVHAQKRQFIPNLRSWL